MPLRHKYTKIIQPFFSQYLMSNQDNKAFCVVRNVLEQLEKLQDAS